MGLKRKISDVDDVEQQAIPSLKDLASSEPKLRRQAVQQILSHLASRPTSSKLTSTQCSQLWRGFHVALYMHDSKNAISVQNLITTLASTFDTIHAKDEQLQIHSSPPTPPSSSSSTNSSKQNKTDSSLQQTEEAEEFNGFDDEDGDNESRNSGNETADLDESDMDASWLSTYTIAFWTTMIREWAGIDSHRMNKYLLLIRMVTRELFKISIKSTTTTSSTSDQTKTKTIQKSVIENQMLALSLYPLNSRDTKIPNGLRIHMLDIYVDEMRKALELSGLEEAKVDLQREVELVAKFKVPIERIAKDGLDRNIRMKAKEVLKEFDEELASENY